MNREKFDVVVIGSGASGTYAAKELTERGMRVLLLEAGRDIHPDKDFPGREIRDRGALDRFEAALRGQHIQCRCTSFSAATRHFYVNDRQEPYVVPREKPFYWFRGRQLGGRLHVWARGALRMSDREFKAASHDGYGEDWPISYKDLAPYYDRVERFLGVHGMSDGRSNLPDGIFIPPLPVSPMEKAFKTLIKGKCPEREPVFARLVRHNRSRIPLPLLAAQRTGRLVVKTNLIVSQIIIDNDSGRAKGVLCVDRLSKTVTEVRGNIIVLCASTIESIRILLNSACEKHPLGLGNSSGTLGRFIFDHVMVSKVGFVGSKLLDRYPLGTKPEGDMYDFADVGLYLPSFRNVKERHPKFIRGYGMSCRIGMNSSRWWFLAFGEMLPRFENKVTLHPTKKDHWGIPAVRIECAYSSNEHAMIADMHGTMSEMAETNDLNIRSIAEFQTGKYLLYRLYHPLIFRPNGAYYPGASIHEAGGARMGSDPKKSVLNRFNQCWDIKNLFVTDGACFVSSGFQNITLTIMALTSRACHYIAEEYKKGNL